MMSAIKYRGTKMRLRTLALAGASLLASVAASSAAMAATAAASDTAASENGTTLENVTVTARRQSENLQNVPTSVVPLTSQTLQQLQIVKLLDIQSVVPGLTLTVPSNQFYELTLRGVT